MLKIAILDDYAHVARDSADWAALDGVAEITVFHHWMNEAEAATALAGFDVLCTMRERMALPRSLLARLPKLRFITIVGARLANLDLAAATELGIVVSHSDYRSKEWAAVQDSTPELTWGLLIATVRHLAYEDRRLRTGGWQSTMGIILHGRTLGLLGLGRIGRRIAEYARIFGMDVIAWSQNLTAEAAAAHGARRVEKDELFRLPDIVSIHVQLSERTRGLVTRRDLALMKPGSYLINTSRGPIVEEAALIDALRNGPLAGAGLDVFDREPLPADHPFLAMENVTLTPHLGYVTREMLRAFYGDMPEAILGFARGAPIRVANPEVLTRLKQAR
jgi:phosphoglycerate dehydrogenase-like enzyme